MSATGASFVTLSLPQVDSIAFEALRANGTSHESARSVAASIMAAEAEGIHSHGLLRLPSYCGHLKCGKVDGQAKPVVTLQHRSALVVDARQGFAHPAIELGFVNLTPMARENGISALAITNSYNCGVVGYHVAKLAAEGFVVLAYVNSPAAIAPWGGAKPLFGTNPIAMAVPRKSGDLLVIDQSSSVVARGEIMVHARQGTPIPSDWALDTNGKSTTDAQAALAGSMLPTGGYKGAGLALLVEIMAVALTGANFSFNASSFADNNGPPPKTGQFFIAISPTAFGQYDFGERIETLITAICTQPGTRLPGAKRSASRKDKLINGIKISQSLYDDIVRLTKNIG